MKNKKFFISTAIDYPSSRFHMGHGYEKICTDVIARYKRLNGFDVHFSTGTDCHGLKIQRAAEKAGKTPQQFVNEVSNGFRELCKTLNISNTDFIMTTEKRHETVVLGLLKEIEKKGDIYKGEYEGLYCVDCETYYTEKDLLEGGLCPVHKKSVEVVKEECYFFRMSEYQKKIVEALEKTPGLVWPDGKRMELLNRLKIPMKDLCISRLNVKWGIPLPFDSRMTVFVWVEALMNYLTTLGYPKEKFRQFWPATHMIGVDIVWHHTAIWYSLLSALGIELPRVVVHGFINLKGEKLSKASGVTIDPIELSNKYSPDVLRYFLISEMPFGSDGDFSEDALVDRNNSELVNNLGNLVNRVLTFTSSKFGSKVPKPGKLNGADLEMTKKIEHTVKKAAEFMDKFEMHSAIDTVMSLSGAGNEYFQACKPWAVIKDGLQQDTKDGGFKKGLKDGFDGASSPENCLYVCASLVRSLAILLEPFMPSDSEKMWKFLNLEGSVHEQEWGSAGKLEVKAGHRIGTPEIIFRKIQAAHAK